MGAWGVGAFENDDALDWAYELEQAAGPALVEAALRVAAEWGPGLLHGSVSCRALAAAEVAAALHGQANAHLPEEVAAWVKKHPAAGGRALLVLALRAARRIGANSELAELWAETEFAASWRAKVDDLAARLQAAL